MISEIRPEDFEIKYRTGNRFRFMGNGRTTMEYDPKAVSSLVPFTSPAQQDKADISDFV